MVEDGEIKQIIILSLSYNFSRLLGYAIWSELMWWESLSFLKGYNDYDQ